MIILMSLVLMLHRAIKHSGTTKKERAITRLKGVITPGIFGKGKKSIKLETVVSMKQPLCPTVLTCGAPNGENLGRLDLFTIID
jgi:hypothetical protein